MKTINRIKNKNLKIGLLILLTILVSSSIVLLTLINQSKENAFAHEYQIIEEHVVYSDYINYFTAENNNSDII